MKKTRQFAFLLLLFNFSICQLFADTSATNKVVISEFMAVNSNSIADEDGDFSDWIELYNNTDSVVNLEGWYLSDKQENLKLWSFPAVNMPAGSYLIVFASDKDRRTTGSSLHTNFKLSGSGEFLAVSEPDATLSFSYSPMFPGQRQDISYGIYHGQEVFFSSPTPGAENQAGSLPFAPQFSRSRGFIENSFELVLSSTNPSDKIYYTLDGTRPNTTNANLYQSAIQISTNTPVSAIAVNMEGMSSEIVTHTYYFIDKLASQPRDPAGYPTDWRTLGSSAYLFADYGMDTRVTQSEEYASRLDAAFKSIPSVTIVTNPGYIFSNTPDFNTGGIYIYTGLPSYKDPQGNSLDAYAMTRPSSVEFFDPKTGKEFQVNCELKLHGGNSRRPTNSPKHGFEFKFKAIYGPSKLNFDLFEEKGSTKEFDRIILRAGYNYTWAKNNASQQIPAQYVQDSWAKNQQILLGQPAAHERFIHLYINGLYWGLYNISEELNAEFMGDYLKGSEAEFDVIRGGETTAADGDMNAWNSLKSAITGVATNTNYQKIQGKNADGTLNPAYTNLLDIDNYIDYLLINYYVGNGDWKNNWAVARNRVDNEEGFKFFCWDTETSMVTLTENKVGANDGSGHPNSFVQYLKNNSDFKVKIADRIQETFVNATGKFTPDGIKESYTKLTNEIELAMIPESARWGDWYPAYTTFNPSTLNPPYTLNDHWVPRRDWFMDEYFPQRTDIVFTQLKNYGLIPTAEAPKFTHSTGSYNEVIQLGMSSNTGSIVYTLDGTDPRMEITNASSANAKTYATPIRLGDKDTIVMVKARTKNSSEWSAITSGMYTFNTISSLTDNRFATLNVQNFPNPFTAFTEFKLNLPMAGSLTVEIWTIDGRKIDILHDGQAIEGEMVLNWSPSISYKGLFICKISFNKQTQTLKLIRN